MTTYQHESKEILNRIVPLDITQYVREFLVSYGNKGWAKQTIASLGRALLIKELLNCEENTRFKSIRGLDGDHYWDKQKVDFVPSNLGEGRGYLFYFICNGCQGRVKYLYEYSMCNSPLCRRCCRLKYKPPSRKARNLSRLLRKPYFSSETRYMIAKYAGITKGDLPDETTQHSDTSSPN